jgi:type I restriction enzyme R subunit
VVGLTATPKDEVDRNTYDFFHVERGIPTYLYEYDTAVYQDHVLVPYYNIETDTTFLAQGITYDQLSEEDRERYDDDWEEAQATDAPDFTPSQELNRFVYNQRTIDMVLEQLMEDGIKVKGGDRLGKTIVFAQNRRHAQMIVERFDELWPDLGAQGFCRRVVHTDDYAPTVISDFETKEMPVIAVSVDMMDTGIDAPDVLNLVFFKQVKSKVKFWQMIGRGTRLRLGIDAQDRVGGAYHDKRHFFIFDWCGNFEFFRQGKNAAEGKNPESLSERIFKRQALLAQALQDSAYAGEEYQTWRRELVGQMSSQTAELREPLTASTKSALREIDKFSHFQSYQCLTDADIADLDRVASLVRPTSDDEYALRFDSLMYAYAIALIAGSGTSLYQGRVVGAGERLQKKATIPQVKAKLPVIQRVCSEGWLEHAAPIDLEQVRAELRDLMKFLKDEGCGNPVVTDITDTVVGRREGEVLHPAESYEDYKLKVNRYIEQNGDRTVIAKLHRNIPMTSYEFEELGRIFTSELGDERDYQAAFGDTPFGRLVRQMAGLDHKAAMAAFAEFLGDESLSRQQMDFVHKVVDYVEKNGYMDLAELTRPPFDQPQKFVRLFDGGRQRKLVELIRAVNDNATIPAV